MYIKYFANYLIVLILKKQLLQPYIQKVFIHHSYFKYIYV